MKAYALQGDTLDAICARYYGRTEGVVETVLEANPGLLELCDRILVLCGGKVSGIVDGRAVTKEEIGLMMTKVGGKEEA